MSPSSAPPSRLPARLLRILLVSSQCATWAACAGWGRGDGRGASGRVGEKVGGGGAGTGPEVCSRDRGHGPASQKLRWLCPSGHQQGKARRAPAQWRCRARQAAQHPLCYQGSGWHAVCMPGARQQPKAPPRDSDEQPARRGGSSAGPQADLREGAAVHGPSGWVAGAKGVPGAECVVHVPKVLQLGGQGGQCGCCSCPARRGAAGPRWLAVLEKLRDLQPQRPALFSPAQLLARSAGRGRGVAAPVKQNGVPSSRPAA
jgi:hypothetical protein